MGEMNDLYKILVWKPEGKRPLGRPRCKWEENIKMDLRKVELEGVDQINLVQDRGLWQALVNTAINLQVL
jgi:hypothetical protein